MLRGEGQGSGECFTPIVAGLTGETEHQVKADVGDTCLPGKTDGMGYLVKIVNAAEHRQQMRLIRLHAER